MLRWSEYHTSVISHGSGGSGGVQEQNQICVTKFSHSVLGDS
jgi:hypothetical protein